MGKSLNPDSAKCCQAVEQPELHGLLVKQLLCKSGWQFLKKLKHLMTQISHS